MLNNTFLVTKLPPPMPSDKNVALRGVKELGDGRRECIDIQLWANANAKSY